MDDIEIAASTTSTPWGSAWGSLWATTNQYTNQWHSAYGEGHSLALAFEATFVGTEMEWPGAHILLRSTGI